MNKDKVLDLILDMEQFKQRVQVDIEEVQDRWGRKEEVEDFLYQNLLWVEDEVEKIKQKLQKECRKLNIEEEIRGHLDKIKELKAEQKKI
tara:strand:- start:879 stop:1148 length:270 start_codon:yes stop_codon:yes gene_type:complete